MHKRWIRTAVVVGVLTGWGDGRCGDQPQADDREIDWEQRTHEELQIHQRHSRILHRQLQSIGQQQAPTAGQKLQQTREQYAGELKHSSQLNRERDRQRSIERQSGFVDPTDPDNINR